MKKPAKIISYSQTNDYLKENRQKKIVLVGGCFDLIHYGHLSFLKKAKEMGNYLVIAIESDEFIVKNKRKQPIHSQKERAEILSHLDLVDLIVTLPLFKSTDDYLRLVKLVKPNIIAVTSGDPQIKNKRNQAKLVGAEVVSVIPLLKGFSTRKIVGKFD